MIQRPRNGENDGMKVTTTGPDNGSTAETTIYGHANSKRKTVKNASWKEWESLNRGAVVPGWYVTRGQARANLT